MYELREKQLMIGIPTKDHPQYISYYLSRVLPWAEKYHIDIHIYDSSVKDETQNIVKQRIKQGNKNLYYSRFQENILIEDKLEYIFVESGYEYVWLCGDGVVLSLERDIDIVQKEIALQRDLIVFGNMLENGKNYKEYDDPILLMEECFAPITYYGGSIVKGSLFNKQQWNYYKKRYLEQVQPACFFEIFSKRPFKAVYIVHNFYESNPYKKMSDWMKKGRTFEAFAGLMDRTIELLPSDYDSVKGIAKKSIDKYTKVFAVSHLWTLRMNGNLNIKIALRYRRQIKNVSYTKYWIIFFISVCPKKLAGYIAVILGDIW